MKHVNVEIIPRILYTLYSRNLTQIK